MGGATRKFLVSGYVLLTVCLLAALIGHAGYMFASVEHTGVTLYPILAAVATEGMLGYITIAQLLARFDGVAPHWGLRAAQVALVVVSGYINFRQAQGDGSGNTLDEVVMSVVLPIALAINSEVGWLVLRPKPQVAPQLVAPTMLQQNFTISAQAGVVTPQPQPTDQQVVREVINTLPAPGVVTSQPKEQPYATERQVAVSRSNFQPQPATVSALAKLGVATVAQVAQHTGKSTTWERAQLAAAVQAGIVELVGSKPSIYRIREVHGEQA